MADPTPRKINLQRIAHAYYKYADLDAAVQFLKDFGFTIVKRVGDRVYFRGYGTEPWVICATQGDRNEFGGIGFVVESEEDLERASESLPQATRIHELEDAPGQGKCVTFRDPVDGFPFHLVYGQQQADMLNITLPHEAVNYVSRSPESPSVESCPSDQLHAANGEEQGGKQNTALQEAPGTYPQAWPLGTLHYQFCQVIRVLHISFQFHPE